MNMRDFRIGWRLLVKEPGYSTAVILGLSVGFAVCVLLLGYVRYCFTYNGQFKDAGQVFVVKERRNMMPRPEWRASAPSALLGVATGEGVTATRALQADLAARIGTRIVALELRVVEPNYLDFFGRRALQGDATAALARPDGLVLSQTRAQQLFGKGDAIGKVLHIEGRPFAVMAILEDAPGNTTVRFDAMVGAGKHSWDRPAGGDIPPEWTARAELYVKLPPATDAAGFGRMLDDAVARQRDARFPAAWRDRVPGGHLTDIALSRLNDLYFDEGLLHSRAGAQYGNRQAVLGLGALALLILALASTNYINLAAVRTVQRQREIGVRKVLGVATARLLGQFVAESLVVCLMAALLGLLIAWLAAPLFGELVNRTMPGMIDATMCAAALALGAVVGVLSALYPAWLAMRLPMRETLHGRAGSETPHALWLRRAITVVQFAVAMCLIGVTLAVNWQADYASRVDPGFDPAPLHVLRLPGNPGAAGAQAFKADVARLPGVAGAAVISEAIGRDDNKLISMLNRPDGTTLQMELKRVGANFFQLIGVQATHGRLFDPQRDPKGSTNAMVNASAARALGYANPADAVGQMLDARVRIVGIAPNLRYRTLRQKPEPMVYAVSEDEEVLTVRLTGDALAARAAIAGLWQRHFPNDVFDIASTASVFEQNYSEDRRLGGMLAAASVVATALASFGIYVLSAYSVRRRAREIVLRKIHGASRADIGRLVAKEFAALLAAGALLGIPAAWLAIERYLSGFIERAPMGAMPQMVALAAVAIVALAATSRHTMGAMRMLPATALRS